MAHGRRQKSEIVFPTCVPIVVVAAEELELEEDGVAVVEVRQRVARARLRGVRQVAQVQLVGDQRYGQVLEVQVLGSCVVGVGEGASVGHVDVLVGDSVFDVELIDVGDVAYGVGGSVGRPPDALDQGLLGQQDLNLLGLSF